MPFVRWAIAAALFLALCGVGKRAHAAGDPSLEWWTLETKRFRIHYTKELEFVAERVARHGESIHERLTGPLGFEPDEKTELVISDFTDRANGSASALPINVIRLFVTAPGDLSPLADYDDWILGLLTHEYTHILHVDNKSGIPSFANAILGKTFAPNQVQPRWIIEGLATVMESRYSSGGRLRSSLFEMFIRTDFIEDNVVRLDQLSSNARRWPQSSMFYLYGSRFIQWIAEVYGKDVFRAISADYGAAIIPWGINRAIRRQTGRTYVQLFEGFVDTMKRRYGREIKKVERRGLREGKRLTYHGRDVFYPTFVPVHARSGNGRELIYFRNDSAASAGLYRIDLSNGHEELVARTNEAAPVSFTPQGDMLFANQLQFRQSYSRSDLFMVPKGKRAPNGTEKFRTRLTVGVRATSPTVSPDGRHVVFTRNDRGTTTLMVADRQPDGPLKLLRTLVPSGRFDQVFTPQYSPDGRRIAYSAWTAGGFRDIRILELGSGKVTSVTNDRSLDHNPTWSPKGDKLYFSSDRTGIYNIYEHTFEDGSLKQVTNVKTGAFSPAISVDGTQLVYTGYGAKGWDLWVMKLDPDRYLDALPAAHGRPDPYDEPPPVKMTKAPYSPLPTLRPRAWSWAIAQGDYSSTSFTATALANDVVGHHGVSLSILVEPNAPGPEVAVDYVYRRLPFDMSLHVSNSWTRRADYRISDKVVEFNEEGYTARTAISFPIIGEFVNQTASLSYSATILDGDLPVASQALDPYASITIEPLRGLLGVLHLGYGLTTAENSHFTAGATRGIRASFGLDVADEFTASQKSLYAGTYVIQGYVPMPWPGHHTLAVRSAGGMATGSFARRTLFFVGGYNLEAAGFPDTITASPYNGAFVMRGYEPSIFRGQNYTLQNFEYRIPIASPDRGLQTLPLFLRRIDGNLFVDWGGAWQRFDFDEVELFEEGALINSRQLHSSAGAELWFGVDLGYVVPLNIRLGYAIGFSERRIPGGQAYFLASSAF
jgi:Tol biopolymer transport system component